MLPNVVLYVDGGCLPNPGPGGYGVVLRSDHSHREFSGGFCRTTNNRMEILAVIIGLRTLAERCAVTVYSDSQYVVNAMSRGWARRWRARNWQRTDTELALNPDLWEELLALCNRHEVRFQWVRGHAGNKWNERCDVLATKARSQTNLPPDAGYAAAGMRTPQATGAQTTTPFSNLESPSGIVSVKLADGIEFPTAETRHLEPGSDRDSAKTAMATPDRAAPEHATSARPNRDAQFAKAEVTPAAESIRGKTPAPKRVCQVSGTVASGTGRPVQLSLFDLP